jgi:hypothetical protein
VEARAGREIFDVCVLIVDIRGSGLRYGAEKRTLTAKAPVRRARRLLNESLIFSPGSTWATPKGKSAA